MARRPRPGAGRRSRRGRGRAAAGRAPRPTPGTAAPTGRCGRATRRRRRAAPGAQQRQQLVQRRPRPGLAQLGSGVGEVVQGARGHRQPGAGRGRGDAQHQRRVAGGRGVAGQRDLPERARRPPRSSGRRTGGRRSAARPRRGSADAGRAQAHLGGERDRARGPGQRPGQLEPVADLQAPTPPRRRPGRAARRGRARRGGAAPCGRRAAGHGLQDVARRAVEQLGRGERVDQLHVAQPAVAVLQVGLDAVGDSPDLASSGRGRPSASSSNRPRIPARQACRTADCGPCPTARVAGDVPGLQQPERGAQVRRRDLDGLSGRAHGVVEPDPRRSTAGTTAARRAGRRPCGRRAAARGRGPSTARARAGPARRRRPARRGR